MPRSLSRALMQPFRPQRLPLAALGALSVLMLAACGGGGADRPATAPPPGASPPAAALAVSAPGELLNYVRERVRQRGTTGGWAGGVGLPTGLAGVDFVRVTTTDSATTPRSGTPTQEPGVDEADLLKTDGTRVLALVPQDARPGGGGPSGTLLLSTRLPDGTLRPESRTPVLAEPDLSLFVHGLLLHSPSSLAMAVGGSARAQRLSECAGIDCQFGPMRIENYVHVELMNVARPEAPSVRQRLQFDGRLIGTRQIGATAYVVTQHSPQLAVDLLPATASAAEREAALAALKTEDVLPKLRVDRGPAQPLVRDTDCWIQPGNASPSVEITVVTAIDLASPTLARRSRCFAGGAEALYLSTESLVLATSRSTVQAVQAPMGAASGASLGQVVSVITPALVIRPMDTRTDLHKFALRSGDIEYRGSGEVQGHLGWDSRQASYRISEHAGHLRVLTFTGTVGWFCGAEACIAGARQMAEVSPARLTVLRESAERRALDVVATLPNERRPAPLGKPGEQVYGVRFTGDKAYVVTFRLTDPLYVLDLANPTDPRVAGELELPGYSSYLFPLPEGLLLGVGRDADAQGRMGGVKVALFDVRDPANPRLRDSVVWGGAGSLSGLDMGPHGINLLTRGRDTRVALPVLVSPTGGTAGLTFRTLKRLEVDGAGARLVPRSDVPSASQQLWDSLGNERCVQVGDTLIYLSGGTLRATPW